MTNLNNTKLFAVEVPEEYSKFIIKQYSYAGTWIMETQSFSLNHWKVNIPKGEYKILGTYSKGVADFDVEDCVAECQMLPDYDSENEMWGYNFFYLNYVNNEFELTDSSLSFTSLLTASKLNKEKRYLIIEKI